MQGVDPVVVTVVAAPERGRECGMMALCLRCSRMGSRLVRELSSR